MGLLSKLLTLPVAGPMRGALWVAGQVHDAATAELNDPAAIRAALTELERRLEAGEIDEETYEAEEEALLDRLDAAHAAARGGAG